MTDEALTGRGSLARVIATRGGSATPEAPFVIEHREALIYMLCEAAELEHAIMCQYLYAAFSMKQRADEGLNPRELERVDRWRKTVAHIATQEMLHLAIVQNLLSAVGGAPHLTRPNLPQPAGHYPPGVIMTLLPFGEAALRHFMFLERPEGMDLLDAPGLEAASRAAPMMQQGEIVPRLQDFATVGHLYRSIEEGVKHLCAKYGEPWLFVGPPEAQAKPEHFGWPQLVQVVDAKSAQRAVDTILDQGEGPRGHWRKAHFGQFVEILDEYFKLKEANPSFEPARPVMPATVRPGEGDRALPLIGDAFTARCTDLFNVVYEVLLLVLERYFAHTEESDEEIATLAEVTLGLMFDAIKPLGSLLTDLPVGDDAKGQTAGPSFELFYESDCLLPHRDAAWALIEERIREAAAFAERLCQERRPDAAATLEKVGSALLDLAHTLALCRADHGGLSRAGEVTMAHRRFDAESARRDTGVAEQVGRLAAALERALSSKYRTATRALLAAAALKADSEGGMDITQAEMARSWKRSLLSESDRHFEDAADLADVLVSVQGGSELPLPNLADTSVLGDGPFSVEAIDRIMSESQEVVDGIADLIRAVPPEALLVDPRPSPHAAALGPGSRLPPIVDGASAIALVEHVTQTPSVDSSEAQASQGEPPALPEIREQLDAALRADPSRFSPSRQGSGRDGQTPAGQAKRPHDRDVSVLATLFRDTLVAMLFLQGQGLGSELDPIGERARRRGTAARLRRSVLRPSAEALFQMPSDPIEALRSVFDHGHDGHDGHDTSFEARLRRLTHDATEILHTNAWPHELLEAVAGLQDLALQSHQPDSTDSASLIRSWTHADSGPSIRLVRNGPYVLTNVDTMAGPMGEPLPTRPQMALCRCGRSAAKPWCDGSHALVDFTGEKDPNRVPDRRDTYEGLSITILDNRGICQHSGFCTDRVPVAFRVDQDPFVAPSGARLDEMIRAVRNCPSGALSLAIDGIEDRAAVDRHGRRPPAVTVTRDGPYRITGSIELLDESGTPAARNIGSSREHYAMCRCGQSQNKPFCSGMHWYVGFQDPVPEPGHAPTLFEWVGGLPTLRRVVDLFFERYVPADPMLAPMFSNAPPDHAERVASWFGEVFGGPPNYRAKFGDYAHFFERHANLGLSEDQLTRWVGLLFRSARETGLDIDPDFWSAFTSYVEWEARRVFDASQPGATTRTTVDSPRWDWGPFGPPGIVSEEPEGGGTSADIHSPGPGESVSFDAHIKALFREKDRRSMAFAFDLWSFEDVRSHAEAIVTRLRAGTMPCDGAWSQEKVDLFQRWVDGGSAE
jgi:CDGSH-type Zn-finger protein/truncated hemoglobin YjbI